MNRNACLKNIFQTGIFSHIIFTENKNAYSNLITIMLDKIFKHIHYYYIQPRKGAPPWWLNLLVLLTALILVCFIWQPIKVFTVSEPMSFSEERGDSIYVVERSWVSDRSDYADWMKMEFNQNAFWCKCSIPLCTPNYSSSNRFRYIPLDSADILLINNKYCLVTKATDGKAKYTRSTPVIQRELKEMGPIQEYFRYKIFLSLFLLIYLMFIYKDKPSHPSQ